MIGASWWILRRVSENEIGSETLSGKRILMTLTENERMKAIEKRRKRKSIDVS